MTMPTSMAETKPHELVKTILVVDDDPLIVYLLTKMLERRRYAVLTADSGERACDILGSQTVQLVITDIQMPGTDGLALTRRLKAVDPQLPVLLMTGDRDRYNDSDAKSVGADGFVTKPFDITALFALISSLMK
jgi:putative two-component system response regulator